MPDLDDDVETGVRGLPHRIGARATAVACPVLLGAASLVILLGTSGGSDTGAWWRWAAVVALLGVDRERASIVGLRNPKSKALFLIVMAAAVIAVVLFAASGQALT